MIFTTIDLELNKENGQTTDIIQIGAVIGDVHTGEIKQTLNLYVKIDKPLDPFIITLTGITDKLLHEKGMPLLEAYRILKEAHIKHKSNKMLIQWGLGDEECLKRQVLAKGLPSDDWVFGFRHIDVKTISQSIFLSKRQGLKGGLEATCERFGIKFTGKAHSAEIDAENTFKLYLSLLEKLRSL